MFTAAAIYAEICIPCDVGTEERKSSCRNTPAEFKIAILYLNLSFLNSWRYETLVGVSRFLLKQSRLGKSK